MFKRITKILWGQNPETDIDGYDSPDPDDLTIDNAYKTRWIWYHTILGLELLIIIMLLAGILVVLGIKLWLKKDLQNFSKEIDQFISDKCEKKYLEILEFSNNKIIST